MYQTKNFSSYLGEEDLTSSINCWLKSNSDIQLINVSLAYQDARNTYKWIAIVAYRIER